ncbi:hypothetical protein SPACI_034160 [Sporomusa acidovorans DSM 3132]|uniref:Uncharacterized protein n=1 Tax=Sporomusa acidovorans (strain ATCC 49682 / DSM 3132 / Mol) TaxID=1123286 RepID=A0ABZ3J5I5_SPOA4|nr:hypothetical protein SPACI_03740 [Sporomusa acidovorans DSM 3132]SDF32123.1 hypothetical protein SAMN04488499_104346 [Sporomusa acidovorans]
MRPSFLNTIGKSLATLQILYRVAPLILGISIIIAAIICYHSISHNFPSLSQLLLNKPLTIVMKQINLLPCNPACVSHTLTASFL